ncbi:hypothetical protein [Prescottella subtropica]|uniref:hypothetical protein n=1 Tax=Prescottella subtropica TaxID=2545757 RepID=UPI0010F84C8B|nr:hypothetical protein [Prescottella subtropica]
MFRFKSTSKRQALQLLDGLALPDPWDSRDLVEQIAQKRGKPITLVAVPHHVMADKVCGLWVSASNDDYLLYSQDAPAFVTDLVICHELSHMLFEHDVAAISANEPTSDGRLVDLDGLADWLPDLDHDAVLAVLGRHGFSAQREYEAEYLATLIMDKAVGSAKDSRQARMLGTFVRDGRR